MDRRIRKGEDQREPPKGGEIGRQGSSICKGGKTREGEKEEEESKGPTLQVNG